MHAWLVGEPDTGSPPLPQTRPADDGPSRPLLTTDGEAAQIIGATATPWPVMTAGAIDCADGPCTPRFADVEVRPGTVDIAVRAGDGCDAVLYVYDGLDPTASGTRIAGPGCVSRPVWSPDGAYLAWATTRPGDGTVVHVARPDDVRATLSTTAVDIALAGDGMLEWLPPAGSGDGAGRLVLLEDADDGEQLTGLDVTTRGGVVTHVTPVGDPWPANVAFAARGSDDAVGYALTRTGVAGGRDEHTVYLALDAGTVRGSYLLPFTTASGDPPPWLAARGSTVVVGDDAGRAWTTEFDGSDFSDWRPLPGVVRDAAVLDLEAVPDATRGR